MPSNSRKANESPLEHGTTETKAYQFDVALREPSIALTNPIDVLYDETFDDRDVSTALLTGTVGTSDTIVTTRSVQNLVKDHVYRLVVEWGPVDSRLSLYWQLYATL